jgi:hypothetical protein
MMIDWEKNASFTKDPGLRQAMLENGAKQRAAVWPAPRPPEERRQRALERITRIRDRYAAMGGADPNVLREANKVISDLKATGAQ